MTEIETMCIYYSNRKQRYVEPRQRLTQGREDDKRNSELQQGQFSVK